MRVEKYNITPPSMPEALRDEPKAQNWPVVYIFNNDNEHITKLPPGYVKWYEWAYKPKGIKQVGCVYTAQGFEFDYIGVIIGPDLYYDKKEGKIKTNRDASKDPVLKRGSMDIDGYIRNIYRVLMSRGMRGCYVYCCDHNLAEYLRTKMMQNESK